jgi:AcrR family transcriptional regulator
MSSTEDRRPQRDKERTRAAVLDAAERAVAAHGTRVSLADIATEAGVTKSGLLHHFPSRAALLAGMVEHVADRIWDEVQALLEEDDDRPGAFTRAYVRASTGDSPYLTSVFGPTGLATHLGDAPDTALPDDAERWNAAFAADGLPLGLALAVRYAADGVLMGTGSPYVTPEQLALVREQLLALTRA